MPTACIPLDFSHHQSQSAIVLSIFLTKRSVRCPHGANEYKFLSVGQYWYVLA